MAKLGPSRVRVKALRFWNVLLANLDVERGTCDNFLRPDVDVHEPNPWEQVPPYMNWWPDVGRPRYSRYRVTDMASIWKTVRSLFGGNRRDVADEDISKTTLTFYSKDDPEMEAAWQKARDSVGQFMQALDDPQFRDAVFYVKKRVDEGERTEHLWLSDIRVEGDEFVGVVDNDPQVVTNVACGETVRVAFTDISDWMIAQGDEMLGGFTVDVLMRRRG